MTNPADIARALSEYWMPIETAPKTGDRFLAWFPADGGYTDFCRWQDFGPGYNMPIGWRDSFINVYPVGHKLSPTHWMPLPEFHRPTANDASTDRNQATVDGCGRKVE